MVNKIQQFQEKLGLLLNQLEQTAKENDQLPLSLKQTVFPLQDPQFSAVSSQLSDYINELKQDLQQLDKQIEKEASLEKIEYVCEKLAIKFKTLHFAITKLSNKHFSKHKVRPRFVKPKEFISRTSSLYQKLTQQQGYERQLEDKIREKELQLKLQPMEDFRLNQDILTLKQRLGRCKQATYQIETAILQYEKRR